MVKALDLIGSNKQLQDHWVRRIVAAIIDCIIASAIWWIIAFIIVEILGSNSILTGLLIFSVLSGTIWFLYSAFLEGTAGATIGKRLMSLIVVSTEGPMDFSKALIRNVSKIHPLLLLVDWLVGFVTVGDPRQRFLDRTAGTTVVRSDIQEIFYGAYQPPAGPMPSPIHPSSEQPPYQAQDGSAPTAPQPGTAAGPEGDYEPPPPNGEDLHTPPPEYMREGRGVEPEEEKIADVTRDELVNMKKTELIKMAKDRGLPVSGTKRDLINRILGVEEKE